MPAKHTVVHPGVEIRVGRVEASWCLGRSAGRPSCKHAHLTEAKANSGFPAPERMSRLMAFRRGGLLGAGCGRLVGGLA